MEWGDIAQSVFALFFVLALVGLVSFMLRRYASGVRPTAGDKTGKRLHILEVQPIDGKRRLVLTRCDGREYLLLLGQDSETVVDLLPALSTEGKVE